MEVKSITGVSEPPCGELAWKNIKRYVHSQEKEKIEDFIDSLYQSDSPDQKGTHQEVSVALL